MNTGYARVTALYVGGLLLYPSASGLAAWSSAYAASFAVWSFVARSDLYLIQRFYSCIPLALAKIHDYLSLCASRIFRKLREDISL